VIVATGAFGAAHTPALAANLPASIQSLHTDGYWAPEDLPPGGVLVVGSGQSGLQIAYELANAGRDVTVAIGRHGWVPRRVYGRDQMRWRWDNRNYHAIVADPDRPKADYPFTFLARWGVSDFNVRTVWQAGARLAGHVVGLDGTRIACERDLEALLRAGDGEIPEAPDALDLASAGIHTVIWSTGYRQDFSWIRVPGVLAANGAPYQRQGVSPVPGIYFVGLHRMWEAGSGTLLGCGWAATNVAEQVATRARAAEWRATPRSGRSCRWNGRRDGAGQTGRRGPTSGRRPLPHRGRVRGSSAHDGGLERRWVAERPARPRRQDREPDKGG
jgi:putative flavoprotein involved in K+ transport